jgi:hypothetical protein
MSQKILKKASKMKRKVKKPLNDKIRFIACDEKSQIYSYTRTNKKSARFEKLNK